MQHDVVLDRAEWIVATVAPWAIAPHPNFARTAATGPERLALISDLRSVEIDRFGSQDNELTTWESALLSAAQRSLLADTQLEGAQELAALAEGRQLPTGARAAAALFSSVAYSELDSPHLAAALLEKVISGFEKRTYVSPSGRLILGVLMQQRAVRLLEVGAREDALRLADSTASALRELEQARGFETFNTGDGIGWDSSTVQHDIAIAVAYYALEFRARMESPGGQTWQDVIRSRPRWLDVRTERRASSGTDAFLRQSFQEQLSPTSNSRTFYNVDPVVNPSEASLLGAELQGDISEIVRRREALGRIRVLNSISRSSSWDLRDGLRLLRQSGQRKTLQSTINWALARGPLSAMRDDARQLLAFSRDRDLVPRTSVQLVAASSEMLTPTERREGILLVFSYRRQPHDPGVATSTMPAWNRDDECLKALAKLVKDSSTDSGVAEFVLDVLRQRVDELEVVANSARRVVEAIDWRLVDQPVVAAWINWLSPDSSEPREPLSVAAMLEAIAGPGAATTQLSRPTGTRLAARLLDEAIQDRRLGPAELDSAIESIVQALDKVRVEARQGQYSVGMYSESELAASFITILGIDRLWGPLTEFLCDKAVATSAKSPALERLADHSTEIPAPTLTKLRDSWSAISSVGALSSFIDRTELDVDPAAIRFAARHKLVDAETLFVMVMELAGGNSGEGRAEAARSIPYFVESNPGGEWALALAVQLSHDKNPVVQGHAAAALVTLVSKRAPGARAAARRLFDLLGAEGMRVPRFALGAMLHDTVDTVDGSETGFEPLAPRLRELAIEHPARNVRTASITILSRLGD